MNKNFYFFFILSSLFFLNLNVHAFEENGKGTVDLANYTSFEEEKNQIIKDAKVLACKNALQKYATKGRPLEGVYVPYWTFDANTFSQYTGRRGRIYYERRYVPTMVNGKRRMQMQNVAPKYICRLKFFSQFRNRIVKRTDVYLDLIFLRGISQP